MQLELTGEQTLNSRWVITYTVCCYNDGISGVEMHFILNLPCELLQRWLISKVIYSAFISTWPLFIHAGYKTPTLFAQHLFKNDFFCLLVGHKNSTVGTFSVSSPS